MTNYSGYKTFFDGPIDVATIGTRIEALAEAENSFGKRGQIYFFSMSLNKSVSFGFSTDSQG